MKDHEVSMHYHQQARSHTAFTNSVWLQFTDMPGHGVRIPSDYVYRQETMRQRCSPHTIPHPVLGEYSTHVDMKDHEVSMHYHQQANNYM